jgi:hypothetical protein
MLSFMPLYPADPKSNKLLTVTSPIKAQKLLRWPCNTTKSQQ